MLITKKGWFSKPKTFNDPFDCYLNFDYTIPPDKYEKCIRWQLKREGRSEEQIEFDISDIMGTRYNGDVYDFMLFFGDWM